MYSFSRLYNVLKVNPSEKKEKHTGMVPNVCQNRKKTIPTQNSISILVIPSPFLGTTENAAFAHFMKKSMHLKMGFLLDYQVLFLLLNGPQIKKRLQFN